MSCAEQCCLLWSDTAPSALCCAGQCRKTVCSGTVVCSGVFSAEECPVLGSAVYIWNWSALGSGLCLGVGRPRGWLAVVESGLAASQGRRQCHRCRTSSAPKSDRGGWCTRGARRRRAGQIPRRARPGARRPRPVQDRTASEAWPRRPHRQRRPPSPFPAARRAGPERCLATPSPRNAARARPRWRDPEQRPRARSWTHLGRILLAP
jgi:hypothetical protein